MEDREEVILVNNVVKNYNLRKSIVEMLYKNGWGHMPSSFSILEIINVIYEKILKYDKNNHNWIVRDYFVLSKAHGCMALID